MSKEYLSRADCRNIQIEILKTIASICEKLNIHYYIAYGTLLGALRHGGFIPWDDDIDISLFRKDYEKLISYLKEKKEYSWLQVLDKDNDSYYYPFAKAIDNRTLAKMEDNTTSHGIWVDIFPLDNVPDDENEASHFLKRCLFLRGLTIAMTTDFAAGNLGKKRFVKRILNVMSNVIGKKRIHNYYEQFITKYKGCNCKSVACLSTPYTLHEQIEKSVLEPTKEWKFEDQYFTGPQNADEYLRRIYGDYMTLPPEDKRRVHSITAWRI